jgi:hypothetical protein
MTETQSPAEVPPLPPGVAAEKLSEAQRDDRVHLEFVVDGELRETKQIIAEDETDEFENVRTLLCDNAPGTPSPSYGLQIDMNGTPTLSKTLTHAFGGRTEVEKFTALEVTPRTEATA